MCVIKSKNNNFRRLVITKIDAVRYGDICAVVYNYKTLAFLRRIYLRNKNCFLFRCRTQSHIFKWNWFGNTQRLEIIEILQQTKPWRNIMSHVSRESYMYFRIDSQEKWIDISVRDKQLHFSRTIANDNLITNSS